MYRSHDGDSEARAPPVFLRPHILRLSVRAECRLLPAKLLLEHRSTFRDPGICAIGMADRCVSAVLKPVASFAAAAGTFDTRRA